MRRKQIVLVFNVMLLFSSFSLYGQVYDDFFGTGNTVGVGISSSPVLNSDSASLTLSGTGNFPDLENASRFLAQAGFGANYSEIEYVTQVGIKAWLEEQVALAPSSFLDEYQINYADIANRIQLVHPDEDVAPSRSYLDYLFYNRVFRGQDVLRTKATFALGQLFVVGTRSIKLKDRGFGASDYQDILYKGAFGNFRDILSEITLHPMMGYYLSHFQNKKSDPSLGTLPDENFAREIMQLFTIGLYELNNDGSCKLDANGAQIPTYDIVNIQELAKIFTGLSGGAYNLNGFPELAGQALTFNKSFRKYDFTVPMVMYEEHHEQGSKIMIDGTVIPDGQTGMEDIQDALDVLFNHPNVGPFVALRLIQQMVTSNPSPSYINRVATAFNNNGYGVRGDMKTVFKAILMDQEARDCSLIETERVGKLRQPLERFFTLYRAFDIDSPSGELWMSDYSILFDKVEQCFMGAPSVFNFFTPFYAEDNYVKPNDMVSPEFQILHSVTAIHYLNFMENAIKEQPFRNLNAVNPNNNNLVNNNSDKPFLDYSEEISILETGVGGLELLLDRLDLLLCHGQLSEGTRSIISSSLTQMVNQGGFTAEDIVHNAIYFIVASADYTILK